MTALLACPAAPVLRRDRRRWAWGLAALAAVGWALAGALDGDVVNPAGGAQFGRFAAAALSPAVDGAFLGVLGTAALVTVAYAVLGTALALRHCDRVVGLSAGRVVLDTPAAALTVGDLAAFYGART